MKKLMIAIFLLFCLLFHRYAIAEEYYDDHSIAVHLGEGNGTVIIIGDHNTIYVPPLASESNSSVNAAHLLPNGGAALVLGKTDVTYLNGTVVTYKRIVLYIDVNGITSVLYAEQ